MKKMRPPVIKAKNFKSSITQLFKYIKKFYMPIMIALLLAIVSTVLYIIAPDKISELTNKISEGLFTGIDFSAITKIGILIIALYLFSSAFSYIQSFIMATVTQKIVKKLRTDISNKINNVPLSYIDSTQYGDILSRVTNDVDTVGQALNNSIVTLVGATTMIIGSGIMMFITNYIMALTAIGASIIGFVIMGIIMSRSQKYFISQQKTLGALDGHIEEVYSGHTIVKAYNGENEVREKFNLINDELKKSSWKAQFFSGLMGPLMNFIGNFGFVAVCVVGAQLVFDGVISFGVIIAFIAYVRLFSQPLSQLAQVMTNLQSAAASSERVFEFLNSQDMKDESEINTSLIDTKGNVTFENVKFGYKEDTPIIKNFSAEIKSGSKIAIVGPTGAGKTTLVNLIMKFYEINSGTIKIDGIPIQNLTRNNIHNLFSMVLQDTWLYEDTIKNNIKFNLKNITDEQIIEACKVCGIDHFIKTLPNGYDTILDDNTSISAGQKQLITIARAMIQNSPMLILDEATSSVDTRTELLIQNSMDKLTENRTSFVIAHRLSTIKNADNILVMRDGDIIECGTHLELLEKKGFYFDLYNSQFDE